MKRILIVLLIMMSMKITCSSLTTSTLIKQDSTVSVKVSDLKYANLIFIEHDKLLKENNLLHKQIGNYVELNNKLNQVDSLRLIQINEYKKINKDYANQIDNLNKKIDKKNKTIRFWQIGSVTVSLGIILFFLLK